MENKKFIFTESAFNEDGAFTREEFYNKELNRYEFDGDVEIKVKKSIFKHSVFIKGNQYVQGNQYVKGNQYVQGNQYVKGDQYVQGNQDVQGYQDVQGDQNVQGNQYVQGYRLLKPRGSITINHIGSRNSNTIFSFTQNNGIMIKCGCQFIGISEFKKMVIEKHGDNQFAHEYLLAIEYAERIYECYKFKF